jgi:hypothetical protein
MARLILESEYNGEKIQFIISPSDALEILEKFQNKYPNALETNITVEEFKRRWAEQK